MLLLLFALLSGTDSQVPVPLWPAYFQGEGVVGTCLQGGDGLLFAPLLRAPHRIAFLQLRAARLERETGVSVGCGYRRLVQPQLALGFSAFLDYARTQPGTQVLVGSMGGEMLVGPFGVRANGYLPWVTTKKKHTAYGADIELAYNLEGKRQRLRGFAGYFRFWGPRSRPFQGPRLSVRAERDDLFGLCKSQLFLEIVWRSTPLHRHEGIALIGFRVPFGKYKRGDCPIPSSICRRMGDPVRRALPLKGV